MKLTELITHPRQGIFSLGMKCGFPWMKDESYLKLMYWSAFGKKLDLDHPKTFNEKLQWLKLYDTHPGYDEMVDKARAKNYVKNIIGEEYIIPTLGEWDHFSEIDFDKLPNEFVLKCTHDSGGVVICKDKSKLDLASARKTIEASLKKKLFLYWKRISLQRGKAQNSCGAAAAFVYRRNR